MRPASAGRVGRITTYTSWETSKGLSQRAPRALVPLLASTGLLVQRDSRYHLVEVARNFLVRESSFYWGPVFALGRQVPYTHDSVLKALRKPEAESRWDQLDRDSPPLRGARGKSHRRSPAPSPPSCMPIARQPP
jgi:hypothetical protein